MSVAVKTSTVFHAASGLAKDDIVMDMAWAPATFSSAVASAIASDIEDFINFISAGQSRTLGSYLSHRVSRTVRPTVNVWDLTGHLDGTPLGSPDFVEPFVNNIEAPGTALPDLPAEVAVCLSLHGDFTGQLEEGPNVTTATSHEARHEGAPATYTHPSRPRARRRGRIYFGPLCTGGVISGDVPSGETFVHSAIMTDLVKSYQGSILGSIEVPVVWSRAEANVFPVVQVKVDNAFDIQRRRGMKATSFQVAP